MDIADICSSLEALTEAVRGIALGMEPTSDRGAAFAAPMTRTTAGALAKPAASIPSDRLAKDWRTDRLARIWRSVCQLSLSRPIS